MRTPHSLDDAKTIYREEKSKLTTALASVAGSRPALAVLAVFMITFGVQALVAPQRLPIVAGLDLAQFGLPPLDFGAVGQGASEAAASADRAGARDFVADFIAKNPWAPPWINIGVALLAALLLVLNTFAAARRWRRVA